MTIFSELIPEGHPNRPGIKLEALKAVIFHYTANDAPSATDTMNARYFRRPWRGTLGAPLELDGKTPFRYGSTQILADEDSVTIAIPEDEVAWACGDRNAGPWDPVFKGQRPVARSLFGNRQNYQSVSVEICNNASWLRAVRNAGDWTVAFLRNKGLMVDAEFSLDPNGRLAIAPGRIALLRHYDVTGKNCPKPFVDEAITWTQFVLTIASRVNSKAGAS